MCVLFTEKRNGKLIISRRPVLKKEWICLKGRTLDRARHRYLERWNDRRVISKIGKGRNCERTRADWGRNRGERRGGDEGGYMLNLPMHCAPNFRLTRGLPGWNVVLHLFHLLCREGRGPSGVLQECYQVAIGWWRQKPCESGTSMVVILTMQSCVTHGTNFQDPRL